MRTVTLHGERLADGHLAKSVRYKSGRPNSHSHLLNTGEKQVISFTEGGSNFYTKRQISFPAVPDGSPSSAAAEGPLFNVCQRHHADGTDDARSGTCAGCGAERSCCLIHA